MIAPLAIIQARMASARLPGKVLADLGNGGTLLTRCHAAASAAFGESNVVVAFPAHDTEIAAACARFGWQAFPWDGPGDDVLARFYHCAHRYRWHPSSVIVRVTADDPFKAAALMRRVAEGMRYDVERGAEAFTLAMLDEALEWCAMDSPHREHITQALFSVAPPSPPPAPHPWSIDTPADLDAVRAYLQAHPEA